MNDDLWDRLDALTEDDYDDLDRLTLAELLSCEWETVDEEAGVVRVVETGELRKHGSVDEEIMGGLKSVHSDS